MTRIKTCRQACYLTMSSRCCFLQDAVSQEYKWCQISPQGKKQVVLTRDPVSFSFVQTWRATIASWSRFVQVLIFKSFTQWFALFTTDWQDAQCSSTFSPGFEQCFWTITHKRKKRNKSANETNETQEGHAGTLKQKYTFYPKNPKNLLFT